ncbi:hypothetical protein A2U01_0102341, partial [Trifolium medium]|nr:hypothetical protein [Trifolium medium]
MARRRWSSFREWSSSGSDSARLRARICLWCEFRMSVCARVQSVVK